MSKFTKGPWFIWETKGADFTAIADIPKPDKLEYSIMELDHEVLGSSEWLRVKPEDLQLMATAPELLRLVEEAVEFLEFHNDEGPEGEGWQSDKLVAFLNQAQAVLKKAKGE